MQPEFELRTLRRAVALSGGRQELAHTLGVSTDEIDEWLEGLSLPPEDSYAAALELVAFSAQRARKRPARRRREILR